MQTYKHSVSWLDMDWKGWLVMTIGIVLSIWYPWAWGLTLGGFLAGARIRTKEFPVFELMSCKKKK